MHFGCVELVKQHSSTYSSWRARHVEVVMSCREVTWRAKWNLGYNVRRRLGVCGGGFAWRLRPGGEAFPHESAPSLDSDKTPRHAVGKDRWPGIAYVLPNWTCCLCLALILRSDFVAFLCPDHDFGTSCHMTYASAIHYLFLNLILRHWRGLQLRLNAGPCLWRTTPLQLQGHGLRLYISAERLPFPWYTF